MRTFRIIFLALFTMTNIYNLSAQESFSECAKLFDNDFRNYYSSYQRTEAKQYFFNLFKQTRRDRRRMVRIRSSGFNLSAVVDLVPIEFGGQNNSQKAFDLWNTIATTSIKEQFVSDESLNILVQSVYPKRPFDSYDNCINKVSEIITDKQGVKLVAIPSGDNKIILKLSWNSTPSGQSIKIDNSIYTGVDIIGTKQMYPSRIIKDGQTVFETLYIKGNENVTITINFDNEGVEGVFSAIDVKESDILGNGSVPIGTIISSTLDYATFLDVNNIKQRNFDIQKSKWAPCDGRNVTKSKYGSKKNKVPDLRGLFVRGANNMSVTGADPIIDSHKNPENTVVGAFQTESFQSHFHTTERPVFGHRTHGFPSSEDMDPGGWGGYMAVKTDLKGGNETRPKNMTVYYYIRIN